MGDSKTSNSGFETAFKFVGGSGRFQWYCCAVVAFQLLMMTWNHMGYIFIGAVPQHWCHVTDLDNSGWTLEQIKNISIPKIYQNDDSVNFKYEQCNHYNVNFTHLKTVYNNDFDLVYKHVQSGGNLETKSCQQWTYDRSIYISTIVSEFDLVCGRRYLVATIQASYMIGAFLGTLVFGPLNDRILGRRNATLVSLVLVLIGGFCTALSSSYVMFICARLLVAVGTAGCMQATSVWFLEHCHTKSRARMYCISSMFFGFGYALLPVYAYFIRSWSNLQLAFSLTSLSLLSFYWIFHESPRWLASNGRDDDAIKALERIARINKMPPPPRAELLKAVRQCHAYAKLPQSDALLANGTGSCKQRDQVPAKKSICAKIKSVITNFKSLLSTRELRKISFTMWALFVTVAFVYYGFAFTTNLTSNPYLLVSLGALMEVPASVLPIPFLTRWGRRPTTVVCFLLTGAAALSIAITPSQYESVRTALSMMGKLFVASAFTVLYLVVSEVYPTVARSTGQGASTLMGRFGSIAAPYVADLLTTVYPDLPCVIFGIVALGASIVAFLIPEMKDVDMKDQVHEFEEENL